MLRRIADLLRAAALLACVCASSAAWAGVVFALTPEEARYEGCSWETGAGRDGDAALRVHADPGSPDGPIRLFEERRPLVTPNRYRLEAWVETTDPSPAISFVMYDSATGREHGREDLVFLGASASSGPPDPRGGWRYGACDIALEHDDRPLLYNIELAAPDTDLLMDGLKLVGLDSIVVNGRFLAIETWSEDAGEGATALNVPRSWRRKYARRDPGIEAQGSYHVERTEAVRTLVVRKGEGEFVLSSAPVIPPDGAVAFVLRARVEPTSDRVSAVALLQYGRAGRLHESQSVGDVPLRDKILVSTGRVEREPCTERLLVLLRFPQEAGTYRVESVEALALAEEEDGVMVLVDQVGYDVGEPMRFLVTTQRFPTTGIGRFALVGLQGPAHTGKLVALGRAEGQDGSDWGSYYFEGLAPGPAPGTYALKVTLGDRDASVSPVLIGHALREYETGELAYRFYSVQRCGCEVPGWHGPCHMDDARLPDGTHVDVTGGYHNAGDFHKHMDDNTPVSVYGMVSAYRHAPRFFDGMDRDGNGRADLLDEALWGAQWMRKMVDPKTGRIWTNVTNDIDYYGVPEHDTDGIPGNADDRVIGANDPGSLGAFTIAAWAALSHEVQDPTYLDDATRLWAVYEDAILSGGNPRHVFTALELHEATGDEAYLSAARRVVENLLPLQDNGGWFAGSPGGGPVFRIVDEGTAPAALARFALAQPDSETGRRARECVMQYFEWSLETADNPFAIIRHRTAGELFYFKSRDGWYGGNNSAYCSVAWAAYLASQVFEDEPGLSRRLRAHASNQIHWILGLNPLNLCMFEGKGNSERIHYHHLYAEIPGHPRGAVPGAIPNGIVREPGNTDRPWFDLKTAPGTLAGAESAEPWLPHNGYYLLMLSAM